MASKTFERYKKKFNRPKPFLWQKWLFYLALGIIPPVLAAVPVEAAEKILINYKSALVSIEVDSLETFAVEGTINRELEPYAKEFDSKTLAEFRQVLIKRQNANPVQLYRFLRTPMGEEILTQVGNIFNLPGGRNGKYAIRAAIVKAAFDESEGLTLLNFLRQFSTDIEVRADRLLKLANLVEILLEETDEMVAKIAKLSLTEAASSTRVNFATLRDLRVNSDRGWNKQTITLRDKSRQRNFQVDLYKPKKWRAGKTPVVVASHGLGSDRDYFEKRAQHLASYGYVVAVPQHPGSDSNQFQDMLQGYSREVFKLKEFIDRPLDISYLLDELERRNDTEFEGKLDLKEVGVIGHSFGGYTALALAGAEIDFEQLETDCNRPVWEPNFSLLVQCRALKLPRQTYNFRDRRVKAVMALNPLNSSLFGAEGLSKIQIPVFLGAGSDDPATPAAIEQIRSFTWLKSPDKYLALIEGQAHIDISQLRGIVSEFVESLSDATVRERELIPQYTNAMVLAFFEYYVAKNPDYFPYLQASYAKYISQEPFNIYLVKSSSSALILEEAVEEFKDLERLDEIDGR